MTKIRGGVPGGWHGGQLPGASAPFLFQFDQNGEAEVEYEIAKYVISVPSPFEIVGEEEELEEKADIVDAPESDDEELETKDESQDESDDAEKPKRGRRKKALE